MAQRSSKFSIATVLEAVDRISGPLGRIQRGVHRTFGPLRTMQRRVNALARAGGVHRLSRAFGDVRRRVGALGSEVFALGRRLVTFGALGGGALAALVATFARAGDNIAKTADKLGLSIAALQEFRFVADRSGVATETFDQSIVALTKRLGEAKAGGGALVTFLKKYDEGLLRSLEATTSTEEALTLILERMEQTEDVTTRNALASAAFSRAGVGMVNMAKGGAGATAALRKEAQRLGIVMGDDAARGSEKLVDSWTNLLAALKGLRNFAGTELLGVLTELTDRVTEQAVAMQGWVQRNAKIVASRLPEWLRKAWRGVQELARYLEPVVGFLGWLHRQGILVEAVIVAISAAISAKLVLATYELARAVKALALASLLTPAGALLTLLAGMVVALAAAAFWVRQLSARDLGALLRIIGRVIDRVTGKVEALVAMIRTLRLELLKRVPPWVWSLFESPADREARARGRRDQEMRDVGMHPNHPMYNGQRLTEAGVRVIFENLPRGARVEDDSGDFPLTLDVGYAR